MFLYTFVYNILCKKMPIEKDYKIRRARTGAEIAEITVPTDWRKYHKIEIGDVCKVLADGVIVILPPSVTEEKEAEVRRFLEGDKK